MTRRAALLLTILAVAPGCHRPVKLPPATLAGTEPVASTPALIVEAPMVRVDCQAREPARGELLIPEGAQWLVRFDAGRLLDSPVWSVLGPVLEGDEIGEALAAMRECQLEPTTLQEVWIGVEPERELFTAVLHGPGVGLPDRAMCVLRLLEDRFGDHEEAPGSLSLGQSGGLPAIQLSDGAAYLPGPDQLVLTVNEWQFATEELARCAGRPAVESGLAPLVVGIDPGADLAIVGALPPDVTSMLSALGTSVEGSVDLALVANFGADLDFALRLSLATPTLAAQLRSTTQATLDTVLVAADPTVAAVLGRLSIEAVDRELHIRGRLRSDELRAMLSAP